MENRIWCVFGPRRDPLYLTPYNERRMEHFGRVAYVNLRFSRPDRGVEGWETDMGKTFIRFGRYVTRERRIEPFRETWLYEDFQVSFISYDSFHWRMELLRDENWRVGGYGRSDFYGRGFKLNERYLDPYRTQKYPVAMPGGNLQSPRGPPSGAVVVGASKEFGWST